nr:hypothetical protein [Candidatus Sigynarchaeota archaeon]
VLVTILPATVDGMILLYIILAAGAAAVAILGIAFLRKNKRGATKKTRGNEAGRTTTEKPRDEKPVK